MTETREQAIERREIRERYFSGEFGATNSTASIDETICAATALERGRIREIIKAEISQEHAYMDTCCVRATKNLLAAIEGED